MQENVRVGFAQPRLLGGIGLKKTLGTSQVLAQAVDRPGISAKFVFITEAVGRWARKFGEVVLVAQSAQQARDSRADVVNGPLRAPRI